MFFFRTSVTELKSLWMKTLHTVQSFFWWILWKFTLHSLLVNLSLFLWHEISLWSFPHALHWSPQIARKHSLIYTPVIVRRIISSFCFHALAAKMSGWKTSITFAYMVRYLEINVQGWVFKIFLVWEKNLTSEVLHNSTHTNFTIQSQGWISILQSNWLQCSQLVQTGFCPCTPGLTSTEIHVVCLWP